MEFASIIGKIEESGKEIPSVGSVAAEIVRLVSDQRANVRSVAQAIARDPSLTARVLKVANSPYYGLRGEVGNLERAVGLLGLSEVGNIALSVAVISDLTNRFGASTFDWNQFWQHSSGCALIAQVLARVLALSTGGEYVSGLLHDVGKILLGQHFPEEFARVLDVADLEGKSMEEAERQVFGIDHAQLGEWLASRWNFPEEIREAIAWHHRPDRAGKSVVLASVVHLADLLTKAKCIGFGGDRVAVCLADDEAWAVLARSSGKLKAFDVERFTFRLDREVDAARELLRNARAG